MIIDLDMYSGLSVKLHELDTVHNAVQTLTYAKYRDITKTKT